MHARNILRALYKETKLGEDVFPYVAEGVHIAVEGFLSKIWAVSCRRYCCIVDPSSENVTEKILLQNYR